MTQNTVLLARRALSERDPLRAKDILEACRDNLVPCSGLDSVAADVGRALASSPCGTEDAAQAAVKEASELATAGDVEAAQARLEACTAGKRMHPAAVTALLRLKSLPTVTTASHVSVVPPEGDLPVAKRLAAAVDALERCIKTVPRYDHCYTSTAEVFSQETLASRSGPGFELARQAFERYQRLLARFPPNEPIRAKAQAVKLEVRAGETSAGTGPDELYRQAQELTRAKHLGEAAVLLNWCVEGSPEYYPCHKLLGSVLAKLSSQNGDPSAYQRARAAYQKFLELAPPSDPDVPKVRQILASAPK